MATDNYADCRFLERIDTRHLARWVPSAIVNLMKTTELSKVYEAAVTAAKLAEEKGMSASTQNRKWRAVFAAQDALKAAGAWC